MYAQIQYCCTELMKTKIGVDERRKLAWSLAELTRRLVETLDPDGDSGVEFGRYESLPGMQEFLDNKKQNEYLQMLFAETRALRDDLEKMHDHFDPAYDWQKMIQDTMQDDHFRSECRTEFFQMLGNNAAWIQSIGDIRRELDMTVRAIRTGDNNHLPQRPVSSAPQVSQPPASGGPPSFLVPTRPNIAIRSRSFSRGRGTRRRGGRRGGHRGRGRGHH